jgi:hypothetical protein
MVGTTEIFISTKTGISIFHLTIKGKSEKNSELISGFLSAVNSFASELGWPSGVGLIRAKGMECRIVSGDIVFCALLIDNSAGLGMMTDPILNELAVDLLAEFHKHYLDKVKKAGKLIDSNAFLDFADNCKAVIEKYKDQTFELYQKLILIESIDSKVPQKWCIPLIEELSSGVKDITPKFRDIIEKYPHMKRVIERVNFSSAPIWSIFDIPLYHG